MCNSSVPLVRWEAETGEVPETHKLAAVTYTVVNKRPCHKVEGADILDAEFHPHICVMTCDVWVPARMVGGGRGREREQKVNSDGRGGTHLPSRT